MVFEVIAFLVAVACLIYALDQRSRRLSLEKFVRSEAWYLYAKTTDTHEEYQRAYTSIKEQGDRPLDPDFIEGMAKGDGFAQDLTQETIRFIQHVEPGFDLKKIKKWQREGKISDRHAQHFKEIVVDMNAGRPFTSSSLSSTEEPKEESEEESPSRLEGT